MSNECKWAVMKGGSASFENPGGIGISQPAADRFMGYTCELEESGLVKATASVVSGAVVEGKEYCQERGIDPDSRSPSELARRGTARQLRHFEEAADKYRVEVLQILVTNKEIDDSEEGRFLKAEILKELHNRARPMINENPSTGKEEMDEWEKGHAEKEKGEDDVEPDNDGLATHIAIAIDAAYLIILGTVDGFELNDGTILEEVNVETVEELLEKHAREKTGPGTGGIDKKLRELKRAVLSNKVGEVIFGNAKYSPADMILGNCVCTRVVQ